MDHPDGGRGMITKFDAIQSLRPLAEFTLRGDQLEWLDSEQTQPTQAEIDAEVARLQAEQVANAYQRERADAYKSLAEQLDLLYWDYKNGTEEWMAHIDAVKAAHPKPE